ncbi:lipid A deacylase LpxR family protein [Fulvivirga lutimaris]|uniref:lipid A deacylase LpxR family protein n=1 Tax=Fulvivirga lutimaris TaxID=1819566 RepID=UPI0012BCE444|nr:lipid A deacylase LpxR family protein [Fulvivirga lutimaris]MTI39285.1 lipid A deacylase LpxR family protein [Fulvivirga lutimaris]
MRIIILCLLTSLLAIGAEAQVTTRSHSIDQEFSIRYENDIVFFTDQYYTSGADINYALLLKRKSSFYKIFRSRTSDSSKVIIRFNYGHKIFTPSKIKEPDVAKRDRPYAGWQGLTIAFTNFPGESVANRYTLELGVVGEKSGMGNFQQWYHRQNGITTPLGWEYEIENELVLNLGYNRKQNLVTRRIWDFNGEIDVQLGNGVSLVGLRMMARLGIFNPINNTAYSDSRLSSSIPVVGNNDRAEIESFLFFGIKGDYVLNNIFIEGSIFNNDSPHVEELEHGLITQQYGYMYSNYYTTAAITIYRLSPEIVGAKKQHYVRLALYLRF